jgi:hypothetical protein
MDLLPVIAHHIQIRHNIHTVLVTSTLHAVGIDWENQQRMIQRPRDVDSPRVLDQVRPLPYDLDDGLHLRGGHIMLPAKVGLDLGRVHPVLTLTADHDLQLRDRLKEWV